MAELAAGISIDLENLDSFETPEKSSDSFQLEGSEELPDEALFPFSQKLSLTPLHDEEVSASASELLYSELTDKKSELNVKNKLLQKAQQEIHEYKLKCDALLSTLAESKKRPRETPRTPVPVAEPVLEDEAPKKKPSPTPSCEAKPRSDKPPPGPSSDDDVPPPAPKAVSSPAPVTCKEYEKLQSILCAYKAKKIIPGSPALPFDLCAIMCKEEADLVSGWAAATCAMYHEALLSALKLVYPNKVKEWFNKPFLRSPLGTAKYWVRVLTRRSEIWQTAAHKAEAPAAAAFATPPESLKQRIRRRIAERRAVRLNRLQGLFGRPPQKDVALFSTPARKE